MLILRDSYAKNYDKLSSARDMKSFLKFSRSTVHFAPRQPCTTLVILI